MFVHLFGRAGILTDTAPFFVVSKADRQQYDVAQRQKYHNGNCDFSGSGGEEVLDLVQNIQQVAALYRGA